MPTRGSGALPAAIAGLESSLRRPNSVLAARTQESVRNRHYADSIARRHRILRVTVWLALVVAAILTAVQLVTGSPSSHVIWINLAAGAIIATVPLIQRFGVVAAPLTFVCTIYAAVFAHYWIIGTNSGVESSYLAGACLAVLLLGIDHMALAAALIAIAVGGRIALEFRLTHHEGLPLLSAQSAGFILNTGAGCLLIAGTVWCALHETARAEAVMESEYERSEALLANMLPASIATRLKDPARNVIADKYDDASVLFADIAGFTERASETPPAELIRFLDRTYTAFDALVDRYGLEKIKVSGDSYMVVSGVPRPRPDHVEALACLAIDMADTAAGLMDPLGEALPLRIGMASGQVVAGVVGSRRFFYDVWGDAVNVASRMETTGTVGRIQVPEAVYQQLKEHFALEIRGTVNVKGKGLMQTWYLVGRKPESGASKLHTDADVCGTLPA